METPTRDRQPVRPDQGSARGAEGRVHTRISEDIRRKSEGPGLGRAGYRSDLFVHPRRYAARHERDLPAGDHRHDEYDLYADRIPDHAAAHLYRRPELP